MTDKWLSNLPMGPLLNSVKHDLRQMARNYFILPSLLIGTESMSATAAVDTVIKQQLSHPWHSRHAAAVHSDISKTRQFLSVVVGFR